MKRSDQIETRAEFLKSLIKKASDRALEGFLNRTAGEYDLKGPQDFLTETDLAVEALIKNEIAHTFPEDAILGEEGGGVPEHFTWVIDPIDGTANFARGIPHFCVIISFCIDGEAQLAAIAQPVTQEFYFAQRGQGAFKNDQPMRTSTTSTMGQAHLELGWSRRATIESYLATQDTLLRQGASIRRGGSGGLALAWVAEGRTDAYLEISMNSWDCIAGMLLIEEAGGRVGNWPRTLADLTKTGPVLGSNALLAQQAATVDFPGLALKDQE
ncbi:Inositol-1-monophosphatase [Marinomonas aquimarina]|uniref:Inositol-1-monophosphatase n=1 Tax=Marinomonas aquimarina TaxID=295068 RepID=A0A1A8TGS8_9GAMM|nr:inositol monophosphatase family protein [Marinomonas aquimarina]SBS32695.1 Inositol-1-monophosphatase [Marinomonas aquimarina]